METKTVLDAKNIFDPIKGGGTSPLAYRSLPGQPISDLEIIAKWAKFEEEFPELKSISDPHAKAEYLRTKMREYRIEIQTDETRRRETQKKLAYLKHKRSVINEISEWGLGDIRLEKPDGSSFRAMRKAVADGATVYFDSEVYTDCPARDFEKEVFRFAEVLVIEHDWAGAIGKVNTDNAEVKLPYEVCAFEFRYSGRPVIALATQFDSKIVFTPAFLVNDCWLLCDFVCSLDMDRDEGGEGIFRIMGKMADQIRAACISLDAEVAVSEVVREPHLSNHGRNSHQPLKPYHVVSLARRGPRPLSSGNHESGRHVRLHFRRGHWRHFETHKTWIKWMLVGDPDLGFIEKHYRI
jgi:hypothetical protein